MPKFNPSDIVSIPQLSQVDVRFKAPLVKNSIVDTVADLTNKLIINPIFSYPHKHIWVKETESYWYIEDRVDEQGNQFDGSQSYHWKEQNSRAQLRPWDSTKSYKVGDCVYYDGKIYRCIKYVKAPTPERPAIPISNEEYWEVIVGEIETYRYIFTVSAETPYVDLHTEIRNPLFQILLGEIAKDESNRPIINSETGFPIWKNPLEVEEVECLSKRLNEPQTYAEWPDENSPLYRIYFQEKCDDFNPDIELGEKQVLEGVICVK